MQRLGEKGWAAIQEKDFARAEVAYTEALAHAEKLKDRQAEAVFLSYRGLSRLNQNSDSHKKACRKDLERCLNIAIEEGLTRVETHARILLGEQNHKDGDSNSAIAEFMRALEASLECQDEIGLETAFGNLGLLYLERGWAEQALECFRQALAVSEDSPNRAAWLGSLGQSLAELGQYAQSIEYYRETFAEAVLADDLPAQVNSKGSEGNAWFELNDYPKAVDCYQQALELSAEAADSVREGIWLGNLSNTYRKLKDMDQAIATCSKAIKTARENGDKHAEAAHLDSLGDCYMNQEKTKKALKCYENALKLNQSDAGLADRQGQRIYLSNIGHAYHKMGQLHPAFDYLSRAIELFDEQRARIKSDDLKTSFAARGQHLYSDMVQVCLSLGKRVEALEYVGRAKSRAILDLIANSPIDFTELAATDDLSLKKLIAREAQLRNKIANLERLFWQGSGDNEHRGSNSRTDINNTDDSRKIYSEWRETVNQLKRRHPQYASLIAVETLGFTAIKKLWSKSKNQPTPLSKNTAILEYYWTDNYLLGAAIWKDCKEPSIHLINDISALDNLKSDFSDFLEMSSTEGWAVPQSLCIRLYDQLVKPLLKDLPQNIAPSIDSLILVPHNFLYRLPFSALHDGTGFLIERFALSYVPTISLIPMLSKAHSQSNRSDTKGSTAKYLVSAISDYSKTREEGLVFSSKLRSVSGLDDLNHALDEAQNIFNMGIKHDGESKLLTNEEVNNELTNLFSQYEVVHFAGHAIFNPDEPLASGLVLSDGRILTAASILQGNSLRTSRGKLLVLSACQTGVNMITPGGEILGLARALMYTGMPNLILSLWEVADRSTAELMQEFHENWQAGKTTIAKALQKAQKQAIATNQSVHAWAPFIHMGTD